MAYDNRALVGVGGWLALFIVLLGLNAVAVVVMTVLALLRLGGLPPPVGMVSWDAYLGITVVISVAKLAAFVTMAWRLNRRHDASTPPLVIKLLWAVAIVPTIVDGMATILLLGFNANVAFALGGNLARPLIFAALWTAYLLRSERVANTYTGIGETDRLATVFE